MRPLYVGLACTQHDPAIAIVDDDGRILFAEGAERHLQVKRAWNAPPDGFAFTHALLERYCDPDQPIVAAFSWSRWFPKLSGWLAAPMFELLRRAPRPALRRRERDMFLSDAEQLALARGFYHGNQQAGWNLELQSARRAGGAARRVRRLHFDHHLTHAAAGAYTSGFSSAACLVVDGFGELSATSLFDFEGARLRRMGPSQLASGASLGGFYSSVCRACGFDWTAGEEWKVMGLAAHGKHDDRLHRLLRDMLRVERGRLRRGRYPQGLRELEALRRSFRDPADAADLAHNAQRVFTDLYVELANAAHRACPRDDLVLAGGCALNSSANGAILERTPFRRLHVFCAPADDGNAVGAALLAYYDAHPEARPPPAAQSPFLGSELSSESLECLDRFGALRRLAVAADDAIETVAQLLADGRIVAWAQGRAEFGPRALGNRSILADPRRADMKDRLNARVKFREAFRPFAPSVRDCDGPEVFERYQPSWYMERTLRFRTEMRDKVPAVVHADGTGRVQSVRPDWSPRFFALLSAFERRTGVPILLNTSLNVMGRPIAHRVEDAVALFLTTGIDVLVLEDRVYVKPGE